MCWRTDKKEKNDKREKQNHVFDKNDGQGKDTTY